MTASGPGIVFMGTPEFAVESLRAILDAGYKVSGVVTSPDKLSGRGLQLHTSPVKDFAVHNNIPVLQPVKLKDPVFLQLLQNWHADLQVVVAFRMLPEEVWNMPPLGTFNLHASLLPQYRGAAPINWAVMNGETKTGVTTFFLNHEIDKGSVIYREETGIGPDETAGDVHDRLMKMGAGLVIKTIEGIVSGQASAFDQQMMANVGILCGAPKIFKSDCRIDWNRDATSLCNFIRGLSPYPTAWTELVSAKGEVQLVKIYFGRVTEKESSEKPGTLISDGHQYLKVTTGKGVIAIERLQLEGKKQLGVAEFLRGFHVTHCRFQ
jgi:methionyl-tRNA formyltransferase